MVQQLEKAIYISQKSQTSILTFQKLREILINYLFRHQGLAIEKGKLVEMNPILLEQMLRVSSANKFQIIKIYDQLINDLYALRWVLRSKSIQWPHTPSRRDRKVRTYLHKIHRIAPIFNYKRALNNLKILHILLDRYCYWPTLSTQLALVIFVTDKNNPYLKDINPIIQYNLRLLCYCSAYAFHQARNKLHINREGKRTNLSL